MDKKSDDAESFSLARWSKRKLEAKRVAPESTAPSAETVAMPVAKIAPIDTSALPPIDTLTFESDFTAFLDARVDEDTRRAALKRLFRDPSFNAMDGLDVYIDDYSIPDPLPEGMLEQLRHARDVLGAAQEPQTPPASPSLRSDADSAPSQAVAPIPGCEERENLDDRTIPPVRETADDSGDRDDADGAVAP